MILGLFDPVDGMFWLFLIMAPAFVVLVIAMYSMNKKLSTIVASTRQTATHTKKVKLHMKGMYEIQKQTSGNLPAIHHFDPDDTLRLHRPVSQSSNSQLPVNSSAQRANT